MKNSLLRLLLGVFFLTFCGNAYSQWTLTNGPYGGVASAIVGQGSSIFAGTEGGGVFVSQNQGATWVASNSGLTELYVSNLEVNGSNLFAGTTNGLFRSSDNGGSWTEVGNFDNITSILNDGGTIYIASGGYTYVSADGGTNWNSFSDVPNVNSITVSGNNLISTSAGNGIYVAPKSGGSGTLVLADNDNTIVTSSGNIVYANHGASGTQLIRSTDGGLTWTTLPFDSGISISSILTFDNYVYVGTPGGGVKLSSDGGTTWIPAGSMLNYSILTLEQVGAKIFAGTGDGVYVSEDYGASWARSSNGMNVGYILGLGSLDNQLAVGIFGPTVTSPDNGATFIPTETSTFPYFARVIIQVNSTWIIASGSELSRSTDHGQSWEIFYLPIAFTSFVLKGTNVFATTAESGVYKSMDEGATWSPSGLSGLNITSLTAKGNNLFASTEGSGVFLSTDDGSTWTPVNSGLSELHVLALASNGSQIFAGTLYGSGVFMSKNNGASWTQANTDLPTSYIYNFAIAGGKVFANTSNGIYSSDTTSIAWSYEGLESIEIDHLLVHDGKIFASTPYGLFEHNISKANQAITFDSLASISYGSSAFDLGATTSSGLEVTYVSSDTNVVVITGNKVTIVGVGTAVITASQIGNLYYYPAPDVERELIISKADQTITFNPLASISYGSSAFDLAATTSSGLTVAYTSSNTNVAVIVNNEVTVVGVGDVIITASQAGDSNFNPASDVTQTLTVTKADQTITFNPLPITLENVTTLNLSDYASSSAALELTFESSDPTVATVNGSIVTILQAGVTTITAKQQGNQNYNPASDATQLLTIKKLQTITFNSIPTKAVNDADINLNDYASVNSGLTLNYTSSNANVATVLNGLLTIHGVGTAVITAEQSGDDTYAPAQSVQQEFTVVSRVIGISSSHIVNDTLSFGHVSIGQTKNLTFTISNTGTDVLTISSITFPSGFSGDKTSGTIPAGGTIDVSVAFSPLGPASFKSSIAIVSDATSGKSELAVSGVGEKITAVESAELALSVYPNPSNGVYVLEGADNLSKTDFQIVDNTGRYLENFSVSSISINKYQLDITTLNNGLYLILIHGQKAARIVKH